MPRIHHESLDGTEVGSYPEHFDWWSVKLSVINSSVDELQKGRKGLRDEIAG